MGEARRMTHPDPTTPLRAVKPLHECAAPECHDRATVILHSHHPCLRDEIPEYLDEYGSLRLVLCEVHADAFGTRPRITLPGGGAVPFRVVRL
jgi:hypothetical protein